MGFFSKLLKVVAIIAVVVAVAWFAAPFLGQLGVAIQSGLTAVGEAIAAGFTAAGEALGFATTTAEAGAVGAATGTGATEAAMAANLTAEGAAANTAAAAGATGDAAGALATLPEGSGALASGQGIAPNLASAANPQMVLAPSNGLVTAAGGDAAMVTNLAGQAGNHVGAIGQWVKDNPLVASTLLKGAGAALSNPAEDQLNAQMEYDQWKRDRLNKSVMDTQMPQYNKNATPTPLRRINGQVVYNPAGGIQGGALQKVMPGYGG